MLRWIGYGSEEVGDFVRKYFRPSSNDTSFLAFFQVVPVRLGPDQAVPRPKQQLYGRFMGPM